MIYNEYFSTSTAYDEAVIDPTCCDEFGAMETMIWIEESNRNFIQSCIKSDMQEILCKEDTELLNEGVGSWIVDKLKQVGTFIKKIFDKIISLIKSFIEGVKDLFKKDSDSSSNTTKQSARRDQIIETIKKAKLGTIKYDYTKLNIENNVIIALSESINKTASKLTNDGEKMLNELITNPNGIDTLSKDYFKKEINNSKKESDNMIKDITMTCDDILNDTDKSINVNEDMAINILAKSENAYANIISVLNKTIDNIKKAEITILKSLEDIKKKSATILKDRKSDYQIMIMYMIRLYKKVPEAGLSSCGKLLSGINTSIRNERKAANEYLRACIEKNKGITNESYNLYMDSLDYDLVY